MALKSAKFAVSLPLETFRMIEQLRRQSAQGRSEAVQEALRLWIQKKEDEERERRYVAGYKKIPEKVSASEPFYRAGLSSFDRESWS